MSDNFNPYSEWLGLPSLATSPNHYQLLGLQQKEGDREVIALAADRAMSRVRACKPGPQAAMWAQLLDQISLAKWTLTDPQQRADYDAELRQPTASRMAGPSDLSPANPNLANFVPPGSTPMQPVAPVQPLAPQFAVPVAAAALNPMQPMPMAASPMVPVAVPYLQPAGTLATPVYPAAPLASPLPVHPDPMAPLPQAIPLTAQPYAFPVNPMAPAMQPLPVAAQPMAPVMPAMVPIAAALPVGSMPLPPQADPALPGLKRKTSAAGLAKSRSRGLQGPILLGGSVVSLLVIAVTIGYKLLNLNSPSSPPSSSAAVATNSPLGSTIGRDVPSTMPRRIDELPESERPVPQPLERPDLAPLVIGEGPTPMIEGTVSPEPMVSTNTPAPTMTPEPEATPEPTREELRALAQTLTTARTAIGEGNFTLAATELDKAQPLAKLDEHQTKVRRLRLLADYVSRFRKAIDETLGRVQAGDQIPYDDDKSFGIVEIGPDLLVIRFSGRNLRYTLNELPLGLASRLAEMSLAKDAPQTVAMKAAFVAVNPRAGEADLAKVQTWWTAAASVSDVPELITAIDDDYGLKQSLLALPLDPGAMQQLTARADRLKDARRLEDFAQEFQAAIDESLKSLEVDTELSVGGSTMVTVLELKTDRIMLKVIDTTRGFQYIKLPLGLAAALAERILPQDAPLTLVMKGAYFAAREKDQANKQFRGIVLTWWKDAGEADPQLQPVIQELVKQYPE